MRRNKFKSRRFERLEDRRLMAADSDLNNGVLEIEGTSNDDVIVISHIPVEEPEDPDDEPDPPEVLVEIRNAAGNVIHDEEYELAEITRIEAFGLAGNDTIRNETDINARLVGDSGNDTLESGGGDDTLEGGVGNDTLTGGRGDDTYKFSGASFGTDEIVEAANVDTDTLDFTAYQRSVYVNLDRVFDAAASYPSGTFAVTTFNFGQIKQSNATGLEDVKGTANDDSIRGNSRPNHFWGGGEDDDLEGRGGDDILEGQSGNDNYEFSGTSLGTDDVIEDANTGEDHLRFSGMTTGLTIDISKSGSAFAVNSGNLKLRLSNESAIEKVTGTQFGDSITGNSRDNTLRGVGGADAIRGLGGADTLEGGADNDVLYTDAIDVAFGGIGRDFFDGFTENPTSTNPRPTRYLDWGLI